MGRVWRLLRSGAGAPDWNLALDQALLASAEALAEGPTVISRPAGLLAWWSTGRNPGDGLTSEGGVVPWMEAW